MMGGEVYNALTKLVKLTHRQGEMRQGLEPALDELGMVDQDRQYRVAAQPDRVLRPLAHRLPAQDRREAALAGVPGNRPGGGGPRGGIEKSLQPAVELRAIGLLHRPVGDPAGKLAQVLAQPR